MGGAAVGIAVAITVAACTFDATEATRFKCDVDRDCPDGTTCGGDGLCGEGGGSDDAGSDDGGGDVCPCSLWGGDVLPPVTDGDDELAAELGVRVQVEVDGVVTAVRFYKALLNTGEHIGNVWSEGGTLLARVTFEDETASGWQEQALDAPLAVDAGDRFVVSYWAPEGHYAYVEQYFGSAVTSGPLQAPADTAARPNGVYLYDLETGFPSETNDSANYWVDLVFDDTP